MLFLSIFKILRQYKHFTQLQGPQRYQIDVLTHPLLINFVIVRN